MTDRSNGGQPGPMPNGSGAPAPALSANGLLPAADGVGDISVLAIVNSILRSWWLFCVLPMVCAGLAVTIAVVWPSHTARSLFAPAAIDAGAAARLSGLAAQFGVSLGGASGGEPIGFYADLVKSRDLLGEVALSTYRFAEEPGGIHREGDLIDLYRIGGDTPEDTLAAVVDRLADDVRVDVNPRSGVVQVDAVAPWPELAEKINRRVLDLVAEYNLGRRQTQAKAERQFIEERLAVAGEELDAAETAVARFLDGNRGYAHSPTLSLEHERLKRRTSQAQQIHASLAQAFERARMDEVRNTPVFTVIESPEGSARPDGSKLVSLVIGGMLGLVLAFVIAFAQSATRAFVRRQASEDPAEFAETLRLASALVPRLRVRHRTVDA